MGRKNRRKVTCMEREKKLRHCRNIGAINYNFATRCALRFLTFYFYRWLERQKKWFEYQKSSNMCDRLMENRTNEVLTAKKHSCMTSFLIKLLNRACLCNALTLKSFHLLPSSHFSEITCRHKNANLNSSTRSEFPDNFPFVIFVILSQTLKFPQHEEPTKRVNQGCFVTCKRKFSMTFYVISFYPFHLEIRNCRNEIWENFATFLCRLRKNSFEIVHERFGCFPSRFSL